MRRRIASVRGFAIVEALVALLVVAVAVTGLTASAAAAIRHVRLARERGTALALATDRLDALRAGPRDAGRDEIDVAGTRYVRTWSSAGGRGEPWRLAVEVIWAGGHVDLESGAFP
jgi:Tfp pilus assembly protein PilV